MSELKRTAHDALSGASSVDAYFGGFIEALSGLYIPGKAEQTNGNHYSSIVDMIASIADRVANVVGARIFKDSTDDVDEFSVTAFTVPFRGMACAFAGDMNLGPLSIGLNRVWIDLSAAPTVTIGVGAAWPSTPFIPLGEITQPAAGHWFQTDHVPLLGTQPLLTDQGLVKTIKYVFAFGDGGSGVIGKVPAGAVIFWPRIVVVTAFDGSAPTLKVGDAGVDDRLVQTTDFDLTSAVHNYADRAAHYAAETEITYTLAPDSSAAGLAVLILPQY